MKDMRDGFMVFFPYNRPKLISKERLIEQLELELKILKEESGASIAGRGMAWICSYSTDEDDVTWYARQTREEFLDSLDEL